MSVVSKELKNLSRRELVDIIYQLKKNEQKLQEEIAFLQESLQEKRLRLSEAGTVADAAISITDLLSTAQKTADLYVREIAAMKEDAEKECAKMLEEARLEVHRTNLEKEDTEKECARMLEEARVEVDRMYLDMEQRCAALLAGGPLDPEE